MRVEGMGTLILSLLMLLFSVHGDLWSCWHGFGLCGCWIASAVAWARSKEDWKFCVIYDSLCSTHAAEPQEDEP